MNYDLESKFLMKLLCINSAWLLEITHSSSSLSVRVIIINNLHSPVSAAREMSTCDAAFVSNIVSMTMPSVRSCGFTSLTQGCTFSCPSVRRMIRVPFRLLPPFANSYNQNSVNIGRPHSNSYDIMMTRPKPLPYLTPYLWITLYVMNNPLSKSLNILLYYSPLKVLYLSIVPKNSADH